MNRAFLVERNAAVKVSCGAQKIHAGFAVVALVRIVDLRLSEKQHLGTERVPLHLCAVRLEKGFLACRRALKGSETVNLDARGETLGCKVS